MSQPMLPRRTTYVCNWLGKHQVGLTPATRDDAGLLHTMQCAAFAPLLERYNDINSNPACEPVTRVREKIERADSDYYIISFDGNPVGGLRVVCLEVGRYRISPVYIMPEYQRRGITRQAIALMESLYPDARTWELDTIAQEHYLCRFYESLGFARTGVTKELAPGLTLAYYRKRMNESACV